jgi:sugar O-acyltransferase (sialic acid O-acetyltransferase NeuD family)
MRSLAILGASGHGLVVAEAASLTGWAQIHFFDDRWPSVTKCGAWAVVGDKDALFNLAADYDGAIVAVGDNRVRGWLAGELRQCGGQLAQVVHPSASLSPSAVLGSGVFIGPGAIVNPGTVIGDDVIVNSGAIVEHECRLGASVHISPGAVLAGQVSVGERSWIGAGAIVIQCLSVGEDVIVGAGACVTKGIESNRVVAGVPARPLG